MLAGLLCAAHAQILLDENQAFATSSWVSRAERQIQDSTRLGSAQSFAQALISLCRSLTAHAAFTSARPYPTFARLLSPAPLAARNLLLRDSRAAAMIEGRSEIEDLIDMLENGPGAARPDLNEELVQAQSQRDEAFEVALALNAKLEQVKATSQSDLAEVTNHNAALQAQLDASQAELAEVTSDNAALQAQLDSERQRTNSLQWDLSSSQAVLDEVARRKSALQAQLDSESKRAEWELSSSQSDFDDVAKRVTDLQAQLGVEKQYASTVQLDLIEQVELLQKELARSSERVIALQAQVDYYRNLWML